MLLRTQHGLQMLSCSKLQRQTSHTHRGMGTPFSEKNHQLSEDIWQSPWGGATPASYSVLKAAFLAARLAASSSRDTASIAASAAAVAASLPPKRPPAETHHQITAELHEAHAAGSGVA